MSQDFHTPVLLQETIDALGVKPRKKYIDATLGGGGHTFEILKSGGEVLGIDADSDAIEHVREKSQRSKVKGQKLLLVQGNFRDVGEIAKAKGFGKVAGILFDLGVSLHQLKTGERGFSFQKDGPLDMRMSKEGATAADLVNGLYENELIYVFEKYGEETMARSIARAISLAREVKKIETTGELARIIEGVKPRHGKINPATQVFQALRIAVNDEMHSLEEALPLAVELLEDGGRLVVISFHSLEDRIVKNFFKGHEAEKGPIQASSEELERNPRARSAKMRVYAKN